MDMLRLHGLPETFGCVSEAYRGGEVDMLKKIKELHVRASVVMGLCRIYMERHFTGTHSKAASTLERRIAESKLEAHVKTRIAKYYPPAIFKDPHGAVIPLMSQVLQDASDRWKSWCKKRKTDDLIEEKIKPCQMQQLQ